MDELIVKRLRGEATDIENRRLDHWRALSPENETTYQELVGLWKDTGEPEPTAVRPAPDLGGILREGDARRARSQVRVARRSFLRSPWSWTGVAAAGLASLIFLNYPFGSEGESPTHGLFPVESSTSSVDITTLGLSDGSVVRMVPDTRVEFPATMDRREVVLEGRAFFAVTDDPVPFVVRTHVGDVSVHGTRFEVRAEGEELRLVVVEGNVRLDGGSGSAEVQAGQVAYLRPGSSPRILDHGDVWSVLEWADGLLIYEATPLALVAEEFSRHFGLEVTVRDDSLGRLRITAWFEEEPWEEVISAVCLVAGVPCEVGESTVTIGR